MRKGLKKYFDPMVRVMNTYDAVVADRADGTMSDEDYEDSRETFICTVLVLTEDTQELLEG